VRSASMACFTVQGIASDSAVAVARQTTPRAYRTR